MRVYVLCTFTCLVCVCLKAKRYAQFVILLPCFLSFCFYSPSDEEHFDANVQSRRTAMKDAQVAKSFQASEMNSFKQEEGIRREQLRQQLVQNNYSFAIIIIINFREERDREAAEQYAQSIQEQEKRVSD